MIKLATALAAIMLTMVVVLATFPNRVSAQSCSPVQNDICPGEYSEAGALGGEKR